MSAIVAGGVRRWGRGCWLGERLGVAGVLGLGVVLGEGGRWGVGDIKALMERAMRRVLASAERTLTLTIWPALTASEGSLM